MSGSSGFETTSDGVVARLAVEIPSEGISSLKELSQQVDRFRTSTEAAARGSGDFVKYLQQIISTGQQATQVLQQQAAALERTIDLNSRAQGGGASSALPLSRTAPQGYVDPFAGMGAGGAGMGTNGSSRAPNAADLQNVQNQVVDPLVSRDPRAYLNSQPGRSGLRLGGLPAASPGWQDWEEHAHRINERDKVNHNQHRTINPGTDPGGDDDGIGGGGGGGGRWGGFAKSLGNELSMGASQIGSMGALARGMKSLSGMIRPSGAAAGGAAGLMDGLSGALMKGGGIVAAGAAGMAALQKGGAMYQGYKNMGLVRGGGAGEGMETEVGIRLMAMNPFLSTEQSRQIITSGLTEGYTGKQFDTVTEFMASNLKNMNISVSDSVQMLRKNVDEGGQSVKGLGASLAMLKELSKTGSMSLPDMQQSFMQTSSALVSAGMGGPQASQDATLAATAWSDNQTMKGSFGEITQQMTGSMQGLAMMRAYGGIDTPAGLMPGVAGLWMKDHGGSMTEGVDKVIKRICREIAKSMPGATKKGSVQYYNAIQNLMFRLQGMGLSTKAAQDPNAAQMMYDEYVFGEGPVAAAQKKINEVNSEVDGGYSVAASAGGVAGAALTGVWDVVRAGADLLHGDTAAAGRAIEHGQDAVSIATYNATADAQNPILNNIVQAEGGPRNVEVNVGGKWQQLSGDRAQVEALTKGGKWRRRGDEGEGLTLAQTPMQMDRGFNTGQTNVSFSPATLNITVDQNGKVTAPSQIQLTPNQVNANAGVSDAQLNNPMPSDQAATQRAFF